MSCIWNESTGLESSHYTALKDAFDETELDNFKIETSPSSDPLVHFLKVRLSEFIFDLFTVSKTNLLRIIAPILGHKVSDTEASYVVIEVKSNYSLEFSCYIKGEDHTPALAAAKTKLDDITTPNGNRILTIGFCDGDDGMILTDHEIVTPDEILDFHSNVLEVTSKFPVANANNIPIDTGIQIEFSEILEANTVTPKSLRIFDRGLNSIAGASAINNNVFTFLPSANLSYNETITIQTTNAILDRFGNAANSASWKFETEIMLDTISPEIIARFPKANANNVLLTTELRIRFSEGLTSTTVTGENIHLLDSYGNPVGGQFSYEEDANTVIFQPSSDLAFSNQHTVIVTNGVKDIAGNPVKSNTWFFTTEPLPPPMQNFTSIPLSTIELKNTFDEWRVTLNTVIETVNASIEHFRSPKISTNEINTNDLNVESVKSVEIYTNKIHSEMVLSENGLANNFIISNLNSTDIAANAITVTEMTAATLNAADMVMDQLNANTISSINVINQDTITTKNLFVTGELVSNTTTDLQSQIDELKELISTYIDQSETS